MSLNPDDPARDAPKAPLKVPHPATRYQKNQNHYRTGHHPRAGRLNRKLEGDPVYGGGRVDAATGEVWPASAVDYAREIGKEDEDESDDPDKWLWVYCEGSRDGYRDMELFIGTVHDPGRADRLEIAISGRGAFRRFKDVLARWPGELDRWHAFPAERQRGRARAWLADAGYYVRKGLPPS